MISLHHPFLSSVDPFFPCASCGFQQTSRPKRRRGQDTSRPKSVRSTRIRGSKASRQPQLPLPGSTRPVLSFVSIRLGWALGRSASFVARRRKMGSRWAAVRKWQHCTERSRVSLVDSGARTAVLPSPKQSGQSGSKVLLVSVHASLPSLLVVVGGPRKSTDSGAKTASVDSYTRAWRNRIRAAQRCDLGHGRSTSLGGDRHASLMCNGIRVLTCEGGTDCVNPTLVQSQVPTWRPLRSNGPAAADTDSRSRRKGVSHLASPIR